MEGVTAPKRRKVYLKNSSPNPIPASTRVRLKRRFLTPPSIFQAVGEDSQPSLETMAPILIRKCGTVQHERYENRPMGHGLFEENEDDPTKISRLLYENSKITEDEMTLLLFAFTTRHRCTRDATADLLELLNFFLPRDICIPTSAYSFQKKIPEKAGISVLHYYCSHCCEYAYSSEGNQLETCLSCSEVLDNSTLKKSGNFFITFDIKHQLESMLRDPEVAQNVSETILRRNYSEKISCLTDITDGKMYKNLSLRNNDLSCTFNTDGVPIFKSSQFSIWPIIISLNELKYSVRCRNNFISGLWFGRQKPNFDAFFQPFVQMCNSLAESEYISWNLNNTQVKSHVFFPLLVTDAVARCSCQGIKQFNGSYGCSWCLSPGSSLKLQIGKKWIYPPDGNPLKLRTKENFMHHLREFSHELGNDSSATSHFGIKSASKLLLLSRFDIVNGFAFDYMHTAFLGVCRTFVNSWLNSKNHSKEFYLGLNVAEIDNRLRTFLVPNYFSRAVRSIEERKFWKASEWRTFLYIFTFVLKNLLPNSYFRHFSKFVSAIMKLSSTRIPISDIEVANGLLVEFVTEIKDLYGDEYYSYNAHCLLHAAKCVEDWGPLWAYSGFQFENYNGVLQNLFNGSQKIEIQISNHITQMLGMLEISREHGDSKPKQYFERVLKGRHFRVNFVRFASVLFFGVSKFCFFTGKERKALNDLGYAAKIGKCFTSCFVNSLTYTTVAEKSKKRSNSVAEVDGDIFLIRKFVVVESTPFCLASKIAVKADSRNEFCFAVTDLQKQIYVFNPQKLNSKFVCTRDVGDTIFTKLVKLPNTVESD